MGRCDRLAATAEGHDLTLRARKDLALTGVEKVDTFDDREVVVITRLGTLSVSGENLHIRHLDLEKGDLRMDGEIRELAYREGRGGRSKGLLRRLAR